MSRSKLFTMTDEMAPPNDVGIPIWAPVGPNWGPFGNAAWVDYNIDLY